MHSTKACLYLVLGRTAALAARSLISKRYTSLLASTFFSGSGHPSGGGFIVGTRLIASSKFIGILGGPSRLFVTTDWKQNRTIPSTSQLAQFRPGKNGSG